MRICCTVELVLTAVSIGRSSVQIVHPDGVPTLYIPKYVRKYRHSSKYTSLLILKLLSTAAED